MSTHGYKRPSTKPKVLSKPIPSYIRTNSGKYVRVSDYAKFVGQLTQKQNQRYLTYIYIIYIHVVYIYMYIRREKRDLDTQRSDVINVKLQKNDWKISNCWILNARTQSILFTPLSMLYFGLGSLLFPVRSPSKAYDSLSDLLWFPFGHQARHMTVCRICYAF